MYVGQKKYTPLCTVIHYMLFYSESTYNGDHLARLDIERSCDRSKAGPGDNLRSYSTTDKV